MFWVKANIKDTQQQKKRSANFSKSNVLVTKQQVRRYRLKGKILIYVVNSTNGLPSSF